MPIEHVVVLCLENRSFDHMLGFLDHPAPDFDGLIHGGPHTNPGFGGGQPVPATAGAKKVLPLGPDHSHDGVMLQLGMTGPGARRPVNDGFVESYERKARGLAPPQFGGFVGSAVNWWRQRGKPPAASQQGVGQLIMLGQESAQVPVLSQLALDFAVFDRWFCSVPGETWPNRNFLHAATSDGEVNIEIRAYTNPTIFELLEEHGATWRIYHDDTPQVWAFPRLWDTAERHGNWYPSNRFAAHAAAGDLPSYSFIEPNHRPPLHTLDHASGGPGISDSQHPENNLVTMAGYPNFDASTPTDFTRAEGLIAAVYEALRTNPDLFARTLLLITYDEHGGLYDHRPPPTCVPAPGGGRGAAGRVLHTLFHRTATAFDFTMLGPRVPAILISPLIDAGTVIHRVHDHASVPATLRALFAPGARPLTRRDAWAPAFHAVANRSTPRTDLPDLSGHTGLARAAEAAAAAGAPAAPAAGGAVPSYYRDFIRQSEQVRQHLQQVGEPEIAEVTAAGGTATAEQTTQAFEEAAHRHRHPAG
jgi:phospholipase C